MSSYYEKMLATGEVKCIDDELPFEIPQGWEWCRLKHICSMQAGKNISASKIFSERSDTHPYRCVGGNGLRGYTDSFNTIGHYSIVGRQGALCGCVNIEEGHFYATEHAVVVDTYEILSPLFMYYFLTALNLNKYATATAQPGLAVSNVLEVMCPLPPLTECERIIKKLVLLIPLIEDYNTIQEKQNTLNNSISEQLKKSILQEAIQGKLVPQIAEEGTAQELLDEIQAEKQKMVKDGKLKKSALATSTIFKGDDNKYWEKSGDSIVCIDEEIPFGIPSSWSWCRLGNIASVKGGKRIPVGEKLTTENTGHMYIRVADMKENTVKTDDIHYISESIYQKIKSYTISTEDLYITVAGTIGSVGEIPKVFDNANLTENADKIVFRGICKKFLMYCLLSNFVQSQIKKCTTKVGQPKLAIVRIEDLLIPLPPIKEQYRIVHKIEQTASIMSR